MFKGVSKALQRKVNRGPKASPKPYNMLRHHSFLRIYAEKLLRSPKPKFSAQFVKSITRHLEYLRTRGLRPSGTDKLEQALHLLRILR